MGLLYTEMIREPSGPGETSMTKKGMATGCLGTSVVNWILGFSELR